MDPTAGMTLKEKKLFKELNIYFRENPNIKFLIAVNNSNSDITLRYFDQHLKDNDKYKLMLNVHGKKYFDPFRRSVKINYEHANNKFVSTSLGQLNFFKFAIESGFIYNLYKSMEITEC